MPDQRTKPVVIIKPKAMSKADIRRMNHAGITVVEAESPESIRFLDPPPFDRDQQERAAISLSRILLTTGNNNTPYYRQTIAEMYVKILLEGTPLEQRPVAPVAQVPTAKKQP